MPTLTNVQSSELVVPVTPSTVHRTVEARGEGRWHVSGLYHQEFTNPFDALMALRADVERDARYPVRIEILWCGVPSDFRPPTTGSAL